MTSLCSDSHTSTQGALGAMAFGVGQSENALVLATQALWQERPKSLRITVNGRAARRFGEGRDSSDHRKNRRQRCGGPRDRKPGR